MLVGQECPVLIAVSDSLFYGKNAAFGIQKPYCILATPVK